ncbi:DUF6252 family protein [Aequorivita capsosiphonis]|uniref:DUF6252 family protein n=1 Tax=Aequorivita capsosiphonis TaxID=487317 RepID=UPI0004106D59|nr:DUF6252 family protein [Aequorivita capsosiphonis]
MQKYIFFLLAALSLFSCEDIEKNDPALQANIDNNFYASNDARASLNDDGSLTIQGFTQLETLTLQLSQLAEGNFTIAEGRPNYAVFQGLGGNTYSSRPDGEGMITISEVNEANKTLTGTFRFNAFLPGIDTIYVSKGVLHNISYAGAEITDPTNAGTFSAKVNGDTFTPLSVSANDTGNTLVIAGVGANSQIVISMPSNVEPDAYTIPRSGFNAKYQDADGLDTTEEGLITILEHNISERTIEGTFSFVTNRSEITVGAFNVTY